MKRAALLLCLWSSAADAAAPVVAVAPLGRLTEGAPAIDDAALAAALGSVPGITLMPAARVREALRAAGRRDLESCEGEPHCLAELGSVVGASIVVAGEAAALANGHVLYLKAVNVATAAELRSTTLVLRGRQDAAADARAAAVRLLAPGAYVGQLDVKVEVPGAEVFLDGHAVGRTPLGPLTVAVGTHALRVTHPRYRDFVRFVDVRFDQRTEVRTALADFGVVSDTLRARATIPAGRPWYQRPAVLAGFGAVVAIAAVIVAVALPHEPSRDRTVTVHDPP